MVEKCCVIAELQYCKCNCNAEMTCAYLLPHSHQQCYLSYTLDARTCTLGAAVAAVIML